MQQLLVKRNRIALSKKVTPRVSAYEKISTSFTRGGSYSKFKFSKAPEQINKSGSDVTKYVHLDMIASTSAVLTFSPFHLKVSPFLSCKYGTVSCTGNSRTAVAGNRTLFRMSQGWQ
jgi:hypothetical protein